MSAKQRLAQLEKARGAGTVTIYTFISYVDAAPGRVTARPMNADGQELNFETREAMTAYFEARDDMQLITVQYVDAEPNKNIGNDVQKNFTAKDKTE